jgi:nitroreductase
MTFVAPVICICAAAFAAELEAIRLPAPRTDGGKPLMQALKERKSARDFSPKELPPQVLSDMLWAACGVNRPDSGRRTAPTAKNMQEIDVYVVMAAGTYLYDAGANELRPVVSGDIRAATGYQQFVKDAPVNLIFVADHAKMGGMDRADRDFYAATDSGYISQNVYLYCASEGLATVVRGWVDKPALEKAMKLGGDKKVVLAQTVGYPAK